MYSSMHSLTSALDGGEWSASLPGRFTRRERAPGTHWTGGWVGPRAVLDAMVKRKIPSISKHVNYEFKRGINYIRYAFGSILGRGSKWLTDISWVLTTSVHMLGYEGVSRSFWTDRLERELQMLQLSATRWGFIAILWVSLVSFAAITLCVVSQRVFIVVSIYFWIHPRVSWNRPLLFTFNLSPLNLT
jgi:hypothetical protein